MNNKIIIVRQRDVKDCGPCSLQSIIRYYKGYVSIEKIREDTYTSIEGTTVYHLIKALEKYGFDAMAKKYLDITALKTLPAIVHVHYDNGLEHFMCLYQIHDDYVILMDPAKGKVKMRYNEFNKIFTGVVIEMVPRSKIIYLSKENNIMNLFLKIIKDNKKITINMFISSILLTIFTILSGMYFKVVFEKLSIFSNFKEISYAVYLFLIFLLFKLLLTYSKTYYENHLNKNIDINLFSNFINHIFKLPLRVISNRSTGEIMTRVEELNNVKDLFSQIFVSSFLDLILAFGTIVILFIIESRLALILCLVMLVYIIISLCINPYLYRRINQNIDYHTKFNSILIENIDMIYSLKNLNNINFAFDYNEKHLSKLIYDNYDFGTVFNILNMIRLYISEIGIFLVNTYAFYLISISNLSIINLVFFNNLILYFIDPIKNIISLIPRFNFMRASFSKICDFIDIEEEKLGKNEKFINGDIKFNNVDYSYNAYYKNINNLNISIKKGEKVMIKGKSGSGKSTICNLLCRSLDVSNGKITIDNINILDYSLYTIRNNIIYVCQKEKLYTDTIKNNILLGRDQNENYNKACNICMIDEIVNKKQFRYDFGIDNNSANISGGERQRIILARALMSDAKILVLDEALSEVDYNLETKIINNIKLFYPDKTLIYVSHKDQGKQFDRVINFEEVNHV